MLSAPVYLSVPHTLFTLEDLYGLHIGEIDGELCLRLDKSKGTTYLSMFDMFHAWQEQAEKLKSGEITEYSCAMKSHFRKFGNQMSGSRNHLCNYASLLA